MNNRVIIYTVGMTFFLMLTACSSDSFTSEPDNQQHIVIFQSDVQSDMTRSRQTVDYNRWSEGDQIAISDVAANSPLYYSANAASTENGGSATFSPIDANNTIYWPADKRNMHYDAWYPYSASRPTSSPTVPANQNTSDATDCDLLYAPGAEYAFVQGTGSEPDPQIVPLTFYHQMAHIIVNIHIMTDDTWGSVTIGNGSNNIGRTRAITKLGVTGETATETTATTWGTLSDLSSISPKQLSADDTNKSYSYECILPPQAGTNAYDLMTIITKMANNADRTYHYKANYNFQAGYQYTYNFELSIQGIIMTASVVPWTDQATHTVTDPLLM